MNAFGTVRPASPFFVVIIAVSLITYLPIEPAALSAAPETWYWPLRLAPDAVVALLSTIAILDRWMDRRARLILLVVAGCAAAVTLANFIRGFPVVDSINALRVLIRYVPVGVLLWGYGRHIAAKPIVVFALLLSGGIQIVAGIAGVVADVSATDGPWLAEILLEDGTTGRYDRYGLFVTLAMLGALVAGNTWDTRLAYVVVPLLTAALIASNSRQAALAACVGLVLMAALPILRPRWRFVGALACGAVMTSILLVPAVPAVVLADDEVPPSVPTESAEPPVPSHPPSPTTRGSSAISTDPNENFRLFLVLDLAPWAVSQEPLLGMGPGAHIADDPDPRLRQYVTDAGTTWSWARRFTNDSNYASMAIQFGLPLTLSFTGLVTGLTVRAGWRAWRRRDSHALLAAAAAVVVMTAALFGPAFETRMTSIVLWSLLIPAQQDWIKMRRTS